MRGYPRCKNLTTDVTASMTDDRLIANEWIRRSMDRWISSSMDRWKISMDH